MTTKAEIITRIKSQGGRITMSRFAVIEALCTLGGHQTTQLIQEHLARQGIVVPEATVYRVLQWLKTLEMVAQTDLGQAGITYELVTAPPHHHLVCLACGLIQNLDDSLLQSLRQSLRDRYGFEPRIDHMAIFGSCQDCRSNDTLSTKGLIDD